MQGIQTVHNSEVRSLKAALERETGLTEATQGAHHIEADTIYVNAPVEMAGVAGGLQVRRVDLGAKTPARL